MKLDKADFWECMGFYPRSAEVVKKIAELRMNANRDAEKTKHSSPTKRANRRASFDEALNMTLRKTGAKADGAKASGGSFRRLSGRLSARTPPS